MWQNISRLVLDQLFPLRCLGCREPGVKVCDPCWRRVNFHGSWRELEKELSVWSAFVYEQTPLLAQIMRQWKYGGDEAMLPLLLSKAVWPDLATASGLQPLPLHRRRLAERGFNQSQRLALALSEDLGLPLLNGLRRVRYTKFQAQLSREERNKNVEAAFVWRGGDLSGQRILLIDDVVTTGSTLRAAAKVLRQAGAAEVRGLCLLRAEKSC